MENKDDIIEKFKEVLECHDCIKIIKILEVDRQIECCDENTLQLLRIADVLFVFSCKYSNNQKQFNLFIKNILANIQTSMGIFEKHQDDKNSKKDNEGNSVA